MKYRITTWLAAALMLSSLHATAASLSDIQVSNGDQQARITLSFVGEPEYSFTPQGKRLVALDIKQTGVLQGLPLQFSGSNLVKSIRAGTPQDTQTLRLLVDLTEDGKTRAVKQQNGANYTVVFTINADAPPPPPPVVVKRADPPPVMPSRTTTSGRNPFSSSGHERQTVMTSSQPAMTNNQTVTRPAARTVSADDKVIIAIDAGHGGQDPGAIGPNGTKEKNVTIAIARKLRALLNADPQFKPVLTRDGDYFISVMGRSDVARKQNANFLVSIHADAAPNRDAGDVLANSQADPYLSQAVLDLQFGHSQRVGYDVATNVLSQLQRIGNLHKRRPEHASLGVLRSPDIPSILVETGFISNNGEERLLGSDDYQEQIAEAIYNGLRNYFMQHPLQSAPRGEAAQTASAAAPGGMLIN